MKVMKVRVLGMLAVLSVASGMLAQTTTPQSGSGIDSDIALLRSDVQTQKTDVIAHTMQFTDAQSQAFWPLYREYAGKQQTIGDQRVSLIKDYADSYNTLDDAKADELAGRQVPPGRQPVNSISRFAGRNRRTNHSINRRSSHPNTNESLAARNTDLEDPVTGNF